MTPFAFDFTGQGSSVSYLVGSQWKGDDGQGLEELRGPPGGVLWVGTVHLAQELQHASRERVLPGAMSKACRRLRGYWMRHVWEPKG